MKNLLFVVFLVMAVFAPIVPTVPVWVGDFERSLEPMKLGDVFAKLGSGEQLSSAEIEFLRLQMNNVQNTTAITSGWIGQDGQPRLSNMYAEMGSFGIAPLGGSMYRAAASGFTIANGGSLVTYDQAMANSIFGPDSVIIPYDAATGKYIFNPIYTKRGAGIVVSGAGWVSILGGTALFPLMSYYNRADDAFIISLAMGPYFTATSISAISVSPVLDLDFINSYAPLDTSYFKFGFQLTAAAPSTDSSFRYSFSRIR